MRKVSVKIHTPVRKFIFLFPIVAKRFCKDLHSRPNVYLFPIVVKISTPVRISFCFQAWSVLFYLLILCSIAVVCISTLPFARLYRQDDTAYANSTLDKREFHALTELHPGLNYLEMVCTVCFFVELLLRFISCPSKLRFLRSPYNILDTLCVLPLFFTLILGEVSPDLLTQSEGILVTYLSLTSVFRVFRLLKLARHHRGLKILRLAVQASLQEILLLVLMLFMGMIFFATLVYFAELDVQDGDFSDIPIGFWWSIITMTTVGYGDKVPSTAWGYLIGGLCAVCGIIITGLPIPIIASNFNHYYIYSRVCLNLARRKAPRTCWTGDAPHNGHRRVSPLWAQQGQLAPKPQGGNKKVTKKRPLRAKSLCYGHKPEGTEGTACPVSPVSKSDTDIAQSSARPCTRSDIMRMTKSQRKYSLTTVG